MIELMQENWIFLVLALLAGIAVAWWLFVARRRTKVEIEQREQKGPAQRNQALIDSSPASAASAVPPPVPEGLAGAGEAVAASVGAIVPTPTVTAADDLTRIKGVGPKLVEQLRVLGITRFEQIAAWDDAEIDRIDAQLGRFAGRIRRDSWTEQARFLSTGDTAGYEAKFGKL